MPSASHVTPISEQATSRISSISSGGLRFSQLGSTGDHCLPSANAAGPVHMLSGDDMPTTETGGSKRTDATRQSGHRTVRLNNLAVPALLGSYPRASADSDAGMLMFDDYIDDGSQPYSSPSGSPTAAAASSTTGVDALYMCGCPLPSAMPLTLQKLLAFVTAPLNVIDLVAIIPFYVSLAVKNPTAPALQAVRVLRIARVFTLLKLTRHHSGLLLLAATMQASSHMLVFLLFFVGLAVVFFGTCEQRNITA